MANDPVTVLDDDEAWNLLSSVSLGRLVTSFGGQLEIFPVNFAVQNGTVLFRTAEGTKLAASVLGVAVAFEIDGYDRAAGEAWSVVVKGEAVEIEQVLGRFDAADLPLFPWHASPKHRFVRIEPQSVTGRRFVVVEDRRPVD